MIKKFNDHNKNESLDGMSGAESPGFTPEDLHDVSKKTQILKALKNLRDIDDVLSGPHKSNLVDVNGPIHNLIKDTIKILNKI
jgi:hypothetical protein